MNAGQRVFAEQRVDVPRVSAHLRRVGTARGIRQAEFIATGMQQLLAHFQHFALGHLAFEHAAEGRG